MKTKEILSIVAIVSLCLCLLCKAVMKSDDESKNLCDKACGAFVFLAIVLLVVSQLLGEENEKYGTDDTPGCGPGCGPIGPQSPGDAKARHCHNIYKDCQGKILTDILLRDCQTCGWDENEKYGTDDTP
jgi:hypothetical protein